MIRHEECQECEIEFLRNGKLDLKNKLRGILCFN
jgi:hypothetical protein